MKKEYTDDIFKAQFATYNRLSSIVELLEPIVGMRGGMYWICKDRDNKFFMDLKLKNMVAGTEIAEKQEVFRKYANIDTIQKLWVDMIKYYNYYHVINREHIRAILSFSKILFKWNKEDLEDMLSNNYDERMEYKALFEGLECLYQKNFYKFKRMLGELIFRLGNLGEYALYSMSEGKIEDKNFTNDFSLYIEVVSDPYKQIQMETIFNLLFKDSDTLRFDYLDLEIKLLVMNDLYNSSLDFDDIIDDVMISHEVDSDIELAKKFDVSVDTIKFVKNVYEAMPEKIIKMEKNIKISIYCPLSF